MGVIPFQDRKWEYRSSTKDMHSGLSVALGMLQYHRLNCHLLLKECYVAISIGSVFASLSLTL